MDLKDNSVHKLVYQVVKPKTHMSLHLNLLIDRKFTLNRPSGKD